MTPASRDTLAAADGGATGPADTADRCLRALGLSQNPFSMAPDIVNFYSSSRVEAIIVEVLQHVETRMGFALLCGEVGLGKTTISRRILHELDSRGIQTALVFNTFYQGAELLREINKDFGVAPAEPDLPAQMAALNAFLLEQRAQGRNCVIIIDDAQNLTVESLELVRQISNMETGADKIVQIILVGQTELEEKLNLHSLRQLKSRIALKRTFRPYSLKETDTYIRTKIARSGDRFLLEITGAAVRRVHAASKGAPRRINVIMGRCLYAAVASQSKRVTRGVANLAIRDVNESFERAASTRVGRRAIAAAVAGVLMVVPLAVYKLHHDGALAAASWPWPEPVRQVIDAVSSRVGESSPGSSVDSVAASSPHPDESRPASSAPQRLATASDGPASDDAAMAAAGDGRTGRAADSGAADRHGVEAVSEAGAEFAARPAEAAGAPGPDIDPAVEGFLDAYELAQFGTRFEAALKTGRFDSVSRDILDRTGLRLVALPAAIDNVKSAYDTLQIAGGDDEPGEYLLFWAPRNWAAEHFSAFYSTQAIVDLQTALNRFGSYQYYIDGLAGPHTTDALAEFQRAVGLPSTRVPDVATLFMLEHLGPDGRPGQTYSGAHVTADQGPNPARNGVLE